MAKEKRPQIKNEAQYEALREQGYSQEKSARIANSDSAQTGKKGGKAKKYEDWTKKELYEKAKEIGKSNISRLNKDQLIKVLREKD